MYLSGRRAALMGIALLIGWLQQNNPATWLAIAASIAAALLLFASWIIDRAKGRTAGELGRTGMCRS